MRDAAVQGRHDSIFRINDKGSDSGRGTAQAD